MDATVEVNVDLSRLKSQCGKFVYHTSIVEYLGEDNLQAIVPHLDKANPAHCQKKYERAFAYANAIKARLSCFLMGE